MSVLRDNDSALPLAEVLCIFAEYDMFNTTTFIQNCIYMNLYLYEFWYKFDTGLYQFLETGTSDRCFM